MFCTNCGKEIKRGNAFCTNCGKKISDAVIIDDNQSQEKEIKNSELEVKDYENEYKISKGEKVYLTFLGIIGIVVAICILHKQGVI